MRHRHTTPFEMCEIKLHVRVPMDCWRQWIRHRTASVNEYSTRYSMAIGAAQKTAPTEWRSQTTGNRQGSGGTVPTELGKNLSTKEEELQKFSRDVYKERLNSGISREQGPEGSTIVDLHRGILEDRSSQPIALSFSPNGPPCTARDPRLRRGNRK